MSHPKLTIRAAVSRSYRVTGRGRDGAAVSPSPASPFTAAGASSGSGSVPAATASIDRPRARASRRKCAAATTLLAAPWRQTNSTRDVADTLAACRRENSYIASYIGNCRLMLSKSSRLIAWNPVAAA
jgi:hypothetical protein